MSLSTLWFVIVAFFWTGFFVLEGFDFGVGALHRLVGRTEVERRVAINTIGPFWDGNEVWLVVAGASMFAAFPAWYASWFSALYLALWLVLAGLIIRGVSFEFRGKIDSTRWRGTWSWTLTVGSVGVPLLLGIGLGDLLAGLPIDGNGDYTGGFARLLTPYGLLVGVTVLALCLLHGGTFLGIRTSGAVAARAAVLARRLAIPAAALVLAFVVWTYALARPGVFAMIALAVPLLGVLVAVVAVLRGRLAGWAFAGTAAAIGGVLASLFAALYPTLLISSTEPSFSLTVENAAASSYSLQVMTIVAAVLVPLVLAYQGWTYWVFRARLAAPPGEPTTVLPQRH